MNFGRQHSEPLSLDDERAMLHESRLALDGLKSELSERVAAVREREDELRQAIDDTRRGSLPSTSAASLIPAPPPASASDEEDTAENALELQRRAQALTDRARALDERATLVDDRERALSEREADAVPQAEPTAGDEREARVEARLAELKTAEALFLRTREELAARSEAVAARERLVAQRERELDEREDAPKREARELAELETRLARLEQGQAGGDETLGFSGGFKKLQQSGARQRPETREP